MKKYLLLPLCVALSAAAMAQDTAGTARLYPPEMYGTMMPVAMPDPLPALPDSLSPLFVNHIGRHGARFLSSEKKVGGLLADLEAAQASGTLTATGADMASLLASVKERTAGRWGALSPLGEREEAGIARGLDAMLPGFFSDGGIVAMATYVPRAVASMYSFCHSLGSFNPGLQMTATSGAEYDSLLRFFDTDRRYAAYLKHGDWKRAYDGYVAANVPTAPARRLVGDGLAETRLRVMTMDMYAVLQSLPAAGMETETGRFMTPEEFRACWLADNLKHALQRTDTRFSCLPGKAAATLLSELVGSSDALAGSPDARGTIRGLFRFAHAETLMPLFSLMRLPGCTAPEEATPQTMADYWNDASVSPLGANLMLIFCAGPSGRIYVRTLLNGRAVAPLPGDPSTMVPWTRLRGFWLEQAGKTP